MSKNFKVKRGRRIAATVRVPGDKSISHRAVILASLADGVCKIDGFLPGEDCLATVEAMRALGVKIDQDPEDATTLVVHGNGGRFEAPEGAIYCGNSGTTMRLLAGLLSAQPFDSELTGDESLSGRPMDRVIGPLSTMGAKLEGQGARGLAPLKIRGGKLSPVKHTLEVASSQVKSAMLLAGLFTKGKTTVVEPTATRDHTERMLRHFGVRTVRDGNEISIYGNQPLEARDFSVPGDISSAAFWIVAAAGQPGAFLTLENVGLNPTRTGLLRVLVHMGANIRDIVTGGEQGEPVGKIVVRGEQLKGTLIDGEIIPNVIDELPVLAVAGALAEGKTVIRDAQELRVKETDRIAAVSGNLRAMGVKVDDYFDGMEIDGGFEMDGATVRSFGDHRIAMAFAIAGLFARGETVVEDVECVSTSYPGFEAELKVFMSSRISEGGGTPVVTKFPPARGGK